MEMEDRFPNAFPGLETCPHLEDFFFAVGFSLFLTYPFNLLREPKKPFLKFVTITHAYYNRLRKPRSGIPKYPSQYRLYVCGLLGRKRKVKLEE